MSVKVTRRPAGDEKFLVPARSEVNGGRVYVQELAQFLHHSVGTVRKAAKAYGFLKRISMGSCYPHRDYVTEWAAMRLIAHFRILQGEQYENYIDFHKERERNAALLRKKKALLRERALTDCIPSGRDRR